MRLRLLTSAAREIVSHSLHVALNAAREVVAIGVCLLLSATSVYGQTDPAVVEGRFFPLLREPSARHIIAVIGEGSSSPSAYVKMLSDGSRAGLTYQLIATEQSDAGRSVVSYSPRSGGGEQVERRPAPEGGTMDVFRGVLESALQQAPSGKDVIVIFAGHSNPRRVSVVNSSHAVESDGIDAKFLERLNLRGTTVVFSGCGAAAACYPGYMNDEKIRHVPVRVEDSLVSAAIGKAKASQVLGWNVAADAGWRPLEFLMSGGDYSGADLSAFPQLRAFYDATFFKGSCSKIGNSFCNARQPLSPSAEVVGYISDTPLGSKLRSLSTIPQNTPITANQRRVIEQFFTLGGEVSVSSPPRGSENNVGQVVVTLFGQKGYAFPGFESVLAAVSSGVMGNLFDGSRLLGKDDYQKLFKSLTQLRTLAVTYEGKIPADGLLSAFAYENYDLYRNLIAELGLPAATDPRTLTLAQVLQEGEKLLVRRTFGSYPELMDGYRRGAISGTTVRRYLEFVVGYGGGRWWNRGQLLLLPVKELVQLVTPENIRELNFLLTERDGLAGRSAELRTQTVRAMEQRDVGAIQKLVLQARQTMEASLGLAQARYISPVDANRPIQISRLADPPVVARQLHPLKEAQIQEITRRIKVYDAATGRAIISGSALLDSPWSDVVSSAERRESLSILRDTVERIAAAVRVVDAQGLQTIDRFLALDSGSAVAGIELSVDRRGSALDIKTITLSDAALSDLIRTQIRHPIGQQFAVRPANAGFEFVLQDSLTADVAATSPASRASAEAIALARRHYSTLVNKTFPAILYLDLSSSFTPQESLFFEAITKTGQPPAGINPTQLAKMVEAIDLKMAKAIEAQFIRPLDLYINDLRAGAARELPGVTGDALEQALKSRRLEFLKNGDVQGLFSESLNLAYRNMRLPAAPYSYDEDKYIKAESYVTINKDLSTAPQGAWLYRGQDVGKKPVVQRGGLNVSISRELIKELDQLILSGKFRGYYKFGSLMFDEDSTALGWKRHDSITLYFTEDLSTEGRVALADVATRHGRGAHELLGEKIVDGFSLAVNVPDELLPKAVQNVAKINPVIGSALKERLTRTDIGELAVSEGLYEAARTTLRRFQISFDYRRDSGLVVDKVSGLASQDVLKLASNDAPRMVDRLAIEAFEDLSRTIRTSEIEIPIAAESKELNVLWKELLRRIELPPAYIVSAQEIVEPSRIPKGSQKFTEYEAFKTDYDKILRKLMTLKGALYKADLTRLNLIKGFTAESSNRIVVTENFEALANPLGNEIRIGEQLFNLDYLVHEMAAMNLPRQLHLYNLVNGSKVNGEYPSHIQPFYTILDELISVTAEVSGRATPLQVTQTVSQRYAQTMDTLVALHKATPRLFSASPETIPADKLMIELQNIVLEQTTRPLRQALGDFDNARITAGQFQERVREFGMKVGWREQVVYALGNLDPKTLAFLLRQVPIAGFNALAQSGDLDFRPPEAASRLQQALVQVGTREQLSSRVNAIVSVGFTKALNANDVVGIPTDPSDSFWKEWERGKFPKGYEFPIAGPRDRTKQNTITSRVYITKGDAQRRGSRDYLIGDRSWLDSLVVEGVSYEGKFMLLLKVDLDGNLPPQYKLSFIANGRNIKLAADGTVPQVVLGLPRALAGRSTFTVQQLVPYSDVVNGQLNRAARAVFQGNFTPQDLEILEGCHIKPRVVTEALAKQNPVSYLSGDGHKNKVDLVTLARDVPQITAQTVSAVQPEIAAMQAARGVENTIARSSARDASTSGLMEQFKWPQAARDLVGALSDQQLQSVLSNNFSAFNAAAQRGDVEAMRAIGQLSLDPSSDKALLKQLVRGALLTRVPKGLGMSGDLDLVVRVRERVLKLPELTKTQRWVLEAGFKEMAREPLTDAERSNLVKLVEFFERGGKVSVPSQLFGGDTVYTPREVITRAAYINWAGEDRSSWREPTKLYQLLLEANILATEANQGLQGDALQRALDRTRSEMGLLGERFSDPKVAARVDRLNSKELYQFLYEYNRLPSRGDSAAGTVVARFKSDEGASPKVPPSRLWDPVIATGARTSDPSTTAKAYLELRDANNRIVWKGLVGKEYNFENVDASRVTLRNYHSDPLLPDLVAEQAAGAILPANEWLDRAAPGPVSATQARVAYTDARTADAIVASTAHAKGQQPGSRFVPDGIASRYGEVEVHSGVEPGRGRFTEVVMYREPQGGQSFRERFEALHAVELGFNSPATHFGEARSFDLAQAVPSASTMFSRRALRGAALGANLALDYVAIDAAILTYFQGGSGGEVARATAQATIDQFKSPEFYAITGTQYLLNAAAASEIPVVAGAGGVLAPVATTAMVSFGVTTLGMNAAWAYAHAPADRQNGAWDAVLAPFWVMNELSDTASDSAFFPAMLHGNSVTREQMKNDPYMSEFLYSIDQLSPGENMANLFGYQGEHQQEPNLNDAINRILDENEASPFLFESEGGEEVKRFAELLLASPESEWKDRINFRRDVNAVAMGDTNRDLAQYLPYEERMGAGGGTNLPQGSWLGSTEVAKPTKSSEPLYINPPPETIDMSNWKMLSLGEAYTQPAEPVSSPAESLDAAVDVVADPQQLGSGVTFPIAEGQSAQQVAEHYEESSTAGPESPEWWKGSSLPDQSPFGPDGYHTDIFEDAAAGDYDYSSGDAPWEYGQYGDATYEFGIQLNGSCIDPVTGEKVPC